MKPLIKEITNISKEGVALKLTAKASLNGSVNTDTWWVSWDRIGRALFKDYYTDNKEGEDSFVTDELKIKDVFEATQGNRYWLVHDDSEPPFVVGILTASNRVSLRVKVNVAFNCIVKNHCVVNPLERYDQHVLRLSGSDDIIVRYINFGFTKSKQFTLTPVEVY